MTGYFGMDALRYHLQTSGSRLALDVSPTGFGRLTLWDSEGHILFNDLPVRVDSSSFDANGRCGAELVIDVSNLTISMRGEKREAPEAASRPPEPPVKYVPPEAY